MNVIHTHCCGLDVHKKNVVACLITPQRKEIRTFSTMTDDLLTMADWLVENKCTHIAMESTASYWKPIFNLLEPEEMEVLVVNAKHIKNVPGRKTDVKDAEWIAGLLKHGLLQGSYIPSREQRELRELVRYRRSLIEERSREANRIQKVLEGANIKLSSVVTDILGKSSREMLQALIEGETDPIIISRFARGRMKSKINDLERALKGLMGSHQKLMLQTQLRHIDYLDEEIARLDDEVKERSRPFEDDLERVDEVPGVAQRAAEHILAEIGIDMNQFPSAAHLCSWAGVAPGHNESAGKRKSGRTPKGNQKLKSVLVEVARAASRSKKTYFYSLYHRIASRRGSNRAIIAVARKILTIIYHLIKRKTRYFELGSQYHEKRKESTIVRRTVRRLEKLGYQVSVEKVT